MNSFPMKAQHAPAPQQKAGHPRPGNGLRLTVNELGFAFNGVSGGATFRHPFRASIAGSALKISDGRVDTHQPKIGKVYMSETRLPLQPGVANANGESWACIEMTPDKDGHTDPEALQVVHSNDPNFFTPTLFRSSIVLILWKGGRPVSLVQDLHFNVRYVRLAEGPTFRRHFFV